MKILRLETRNVKKVSVVEISPDGPVVEVTGPNGAGKSSILDSIYLALTDAKAMPAKPIREGEENAIVRMDLGDLLITKRIKKADDGTYLSSVTVERLDGEIVKKPHATLDALVGKLTFDPLAILGMDDPTLFKTFRSFVPDVDFDAIEKANADDVEARKALKREVAEANAQADAIVVPAGADEAQVDINGLMEQLAASSETNMAIERERMRREGEEQKAARLDADAAQKRAQAKTLIDAAKDLEKQSTDIRKALKTAMDLRAPVDTADLQKQIKEGQAKNEAAAQITKRRELQQKAAAADAKIKAINDAIARRNDDAKASVAAAKMPIDGIGFEGQIVTLNGHPLRQASTAQTIRAGLAIGAALNPTLRIALVRNGSLLDQAAWDEMRKMAEELDLQVWVETVESGRADAFVIEDGRVARRLEAAE